MYCRYSDSLKFLAIQGANMEACDKVTKTFGEGMS